MKVISEYNYSPNSFARTLAGKKSNTIGVFLIIQGEEKQDKIFQNDFFASYLDILVDIAAQNDYYVLVSVIKDPKNYMKINRAFAEKRIDGGIIIASKKDTLEGIQASDIRSNIVLFDYDLTKAEKETYKKTNISTINAQDANGIEKAVEFLYNNGHREIGFIKGRDLSRSGYIRFRAYLEAMENRGLTVKEQFIVDGQFSTLKAYTLIQEKIALNELPTAYISANDSMAFSAIKAFKEAGINVPEDISIIGFDNTQKANELEPHLTSLGPDYIAMSEAAIDILSKQISEEDMTAKYLEFEVDLHVRDTTKNINPN
jgi:LacI family transcriptional regulator